MWKLDLLDRIISVTVMERTELRRHFPPFTPAEGTDRNVEFSFSYPDDRVQNCNTYVCNLS